MIVHYKCLMVVVLRFNIVSMTWNNIPTEKSSNVQVAIHIHPIKCSFGVCGISLVATTGNVATANNLVMIILNVLSRVF